MQHIINNTNCKHYHDCVVDAISFFLIILKPEHQQRQNLSLLSIILNNLTALP